MYKIRIGILFLFSTFHVLNLSAQSLAECIEHAKSHSLRIKAVDLETQRAKRNEGSYFEIDKTELTLGQDPTSGGSPDNALTLSQSIDFPTVYSSRRKLLKAETDVKRAEAKLTVNELSKEVSLAYTDMLFYHHQVEILKQNDSLLTDFVRNTKIRFENKETNRIEVISAEQQLVQNTLKLQTALNSEKSASDRLQNLMNTESSIKPTDDYVPAYLSANDMLADGFSYIASPQGELNKMEQIRAEKNLTYTKQGYMPTFSLGLRNQLVISGINPYNIERNKFDGGNWMGFEVGVAFPLFFGSQKAKTAVAKYDVDIASARLEEEKQKADTEYKIGRNTMLTAYSNYQKQISTALPNAKEIRSLSLTEYKAGEITYAEHILNLNAALDIELSVAQATDDLNKAIINLKSITGK